MVSMLIQAGAGINAEDQNQISRAAARAKKNGFHYLVDMLMSYMRTGVLRICTDDQMPRATMQETVFEDSTLAALVEGESGSDQSTSDEGSSPSDGESDSPEGSEMDDSAFDELLHGDVMEMENTISWNGVDPLTACPGAPGYAVGPDWEL